MHLARYKAATLLTTMAGAEGASPGTKAGAWAHVTQAKRAVGCPDDAAAVPPTEHSGAMGATYEAAETRSVEKGCAVSPGAFPLFLFTLNGGSCRG